METTHLIPADEFCIHHQIQASFIYSLKESGLMELVVRDEKLFIPDNQLQQLEKLVRLRYEMDINLEGIETITYLLQRIFDMQAEITGLKNKLQVYEAG